MDRQHKRLLRLADELAALTEEERIAREELAFHRHLHDDAVRDAAVTEHPIDRKDARLTLGDVVRMQAHIRRIEQRRVEIQAERQRILDQLED